MSFRVSDLVAQGIIQGNSAYATIFYDSQDTGYYVDPNSVSNLYNAYIGRVLINWDGTDTWFRMQSGNRMRITTTGGTDFIIPNTGNMTYNGNTVWHAGNDGSGSGLDADLLDGYHVSSLYIKSGDTLTGPMVLNDSAYFRGSSTYGFRFNNNADTLNNMTLTNANGDLYVRGQVYVGGNGSSTGNILASQSWVSSQGYVTGGPYLPLSGGTLTGNLNISSSGSIDNQFAASGANGWRFIFASAANPEGFGVGAQGFGIYRNGLGDYHLKFDTSGNVTAPYSMRAPIFYDSNDTNYYLDPTSLSNLTRIQTKQNWYDNSATDWGGGLNVQGTNASIGWQPSSQSWWYMMHSASNNMNFYRRSTSGSWNQDGIWYADGSLSWTNAIRATIFYDYNDTSYYLDPAADLSFRTSGYIGSYRNDTQGIIQTHNTSAGSPVQLSLRHSYGDVIMQNYRGWIYLYANAVQTDNSFRAPIFYDSQDTNYYVDPNGASKLNGLHIVSSGNNVSGNDASLYIGGNNNDWGIIVGKASYDYGILVEVSGGATYAYSSPNFRVNGAGATFSTIYYDTNDTSYYLDPNNGGTSLVVAGTMYGARLLLGSGTSEGAIGNGGLRIGRTDTNYTHGSAWSGTSSTMFIDCATTATITIHDSGNRLVEYLTYSGDATNTIYTGRSIGWGTTNWVFGDVASAIGSFRAPIFYDSNDTGYYLDPNGGSNLNGVSIDNYLQVVSGRADASHGHVGLFRSSQYASTNYVPFSFESTYGTHSWGIVARYRINTGGQDRPSIQFSYAGSDNRWNVGYNTGSDDNFRITQNMGYRNDNSTSDGWGTERFRIDTDGTTYVGMGGGTVYLKYGGSDKFWTGSDGTRTQGWSYYQDASAGMHWPSNNWHLMPINSADFRVYSGNASESSLRMETNGTTRGYFYTNSSNEIGILNSGRSWGFRMNNSLNAFIHGNQLTINADNASWSSIYMNDGDEGVREIHCNSNRIGFLTQGGSWGSWCGDGGDWFSDHSMRAPIFYDYNNTNYYGDFASTSRMAYVTMDQSTGAHNHMTYGGYFSGGDWQTLTNTEGQLNVVQVNNINAGGYSNQPPNVYTYGGVLSWRTSNHSFQLYASHTGDITFKTQWNNDNYSGWRRILHESNFNTWAPTLTGGGASGTWGINITGNAGYASSAGNADTVDGYHASGLWKLNEWNGNIYGHTDGRIYGTIFYDANDSSYYCDPNSTSRFNVVGSFGLQNNYGVGTDYQFGISFNNSFDSAYAIFRESGAWSYPYPDLRIAFHTGIKLGANASYNGIRFYTDYDMSSQVMSVNNGSDPLGGGNVYVNNSLQAGSSLRAPIFYDSNDTTYYADFNNTGRSMYTAGYLQSDRLIMKGSSGGGQIYPTISYGGVSLYGGDQLTNGAYFTVTGIDYGSSPGAGSAEFVIRSTATSKFALFSYNGSTWTGRYGLFGSTGNVTIGDANTDIGYRLYVIGDIYATGNVIAYSDARVKTNIREIENPLARVLNTRGVMYDRTDNEEKDNVGFIAQELEKEFPELISTSTDGRKGVKYQNMVAVLIEAMKEQNKEIQKLKMLINGASR